jgi:hypothetical protein
VRELRRQIERKAYERNQIASPEESSAPETGIFKDPYFLIFSACATAMTKLILKRRSCFS